MTESLRSGNNLRNILFKFLESKNVQFILINNRICKYINYCLKKEKHLYLRYV